MLCLSLNKTGSTLPWGRSSFKRRLIRIRYYCLLPLAFSMERLYLLLGHLTATLEVADYFFLMALFALHLVNYSLIFIKGLLKVLILAYQLRSQGHVLLFHVQVPSLQIIISLLQSYLLRVLF